MREIKFRAWDKKDEVMVAFDHSDFAVVSERVRNYALGYDSEGNYRRQDNITYMQYAGLKDKNGVEIYEGDVIEYRAYMAWHRDVIKFTNGEFHGQLSGLKEEHQSRYSLGLIVSLGAEVIGNIYENPELLKEKLL